MTKPIQQSVTFPVPPRAAYETYMNSAKHSAATGQRAKLTRKVGANFTAFDGDLNGRNLLLIPNRMIVQSWRASHWPKTDPDSILTITFTKIAKGTRVDLVHVNVPQHDHRGVTQGWHTYYWIPWRNYFSALKKNR
ncbi:MAG TPA: SRPBCC domain-containing protein [Candidatus Koribacter sp.]